MGRPASARASSGRPPPPGLAATIKKFPNEGRYVPRMLDKLKDVCKEFSGGKEYLARTYLELMRKVDPKRGDEVTKYFVKLSGDALAFFQAEKKAKEAAEVEQIRTRAGVRSGDEGLTAGRVTGPGPGPPVTRGR